MSVLARIHPDDLQMTIVVCSLAAIPLILLLILRPRAAIAAFCGGLAAFACFFVFAQIASTARSSEAFEGGLGVSLVISLVIGTVVAFLLYPRKKAEPDQRQEPGQP